MSTSKQHFISLNRCTIVSCTLLSVLVVGCDSASTGAPPFQVITPIEGSWNSDSGEILSFNGFNLGFDGNEDGDVGFPTVFNLTGSIDDPKNYCDSTETNVNFLPLEGTIDNGELTLYVQDSGNKNVCLHGIFTDMVTLTLDANDARIGSIYANDRIEVALTVDGGVWESSDSGSGKVSLLFDEPFSVTNNDQADVTGCDLSANAVQVNFNGVINGFDTQNRTNPVIPKILADTGSTELYTNFTFKDRDTATVQNVNGKTLNLSRTPSMLKQSDLPSGCSITL